MNSGIRIPLFMSSLPVNKNRNVALDELAYDCYCWYFHVNQLII